MSREYEIGTQRSLPQRPTAGRQPTTPRCAAGTPHGPGVRTGPKAALSLVIPSANSCRLVLPSTAVPAARSRATAYWSHAGREFGRTGVLPVVGRSTVSNLSLMASGTPASRPTPASARSVRLSKAFRSEIALAAATLRDHLSGGRPTRSRTCFAAPRLARRSRHRIGRQLAHRTVAAARATASPSPTHQLGTPRTGISRVIMASTAISGLTFSSNAARQASTASSRCSTDSWVHSAAARRMSGS